MAEFTDWTTEPTIEDLSAPKYVNGFEIFWSQWDFLCSFHHIFRVPADADKPNMGRISVSRLVMSPQHAKVLSQILNQQVANFEEKYGEIPVAEESAG